MKRLINKIIFNVVIFLTVTSAQEYSIISVEGIGENHSAEDVSVNGSVVGEVWYPPYGGKGFIYQNGVMSLIDFGSSTTFILVSSLNNEDSYVGEAHYQSSSRGFLNGFLLPTLPGGNYAAAKDINNLNQVVGWSQNSNLEDHVFLYENGNIYDLGFEGEPFAINDSGMIVGIYYDNVSFNNYSFLFNYSSGQLIYIPPYGNGDFECYDINNQNQIVGFYELSDTEGRAFLLENGTVITLPTLGGNSAYAEAVNDSGIIVGLSRITIMPPHVNHAFIYDKTHGIRDLNNLLIQGGTGWVLENATGINNYGQITGTGKLDGVSKSFLLTPFIVTNPKSGDHWISGETDTIKWIETGWTSLNIKCITNFGTPDSTEIVVAIGVSLVEPEFIWNIPDTLISYQSKIIVENANNPEEKIGSDIFRIKPYVLTRVKDDSTYYAYDITKDRWGFGNTRIEMWDSAWYSQFNYQGIDPFTNNLQYSQSQGDSTFGKSKSHYHPDWVSWVNTFTIDACYFSAPNGIYRPTALLKWWADSDKWGGSCFGIAISNALAFGHKEQFETKYPNFPSFVNPISVLSDNNVKKVVNELFTYQSGNPHLTYRSNIGLNKTPTQTLNDLKEMFKEDVTQVRTLSFNNNPPGSGGHAILAYKVEKDTTTPYIFYVYVYDNSYSDSLNARIVFNTTANGGNGSWSFNHWPSWGGNKWIYLRDPASNYFLNPTMAKGIMQQSPFILGDDFLRVNTGIDASVRIQDTNGNITGYFNGNIQDEIPNSYPLIVDNGSETLPYGYSLLTDNYSVQLSDFQSDTIETFFFTGNKSFSYERRGATQTQTDRLFFDGGVSAVNPEAQTRTIKLLNLINETTQEKLVVVRSIALAQNDSVKIENPDSDKAKLISYGTAKEYDIELNYVTENGIGRFGDFNVLLSANTTHTLVPDWTNITNTELQVLVDIGNDGTIDDTLYLTNKLTGIEDQGSLFSPNSYNLAQNYPNPFNPTTKIKYQLPQNSFVTLKIFDILGREVTTLVNEEKTTGSYEVEFDGEGLASGIYLYRLQASDPSSGSGQGFVETKKMILLR